MPDTTSTPAEPNSAVGTADGLELLAGDQMELVGPNGTAAPLVLVIRRLLLGRPRLDTAAVIARAGPAARRARGGRAVHLVDARLPCRGRDREF